jgi:very-short-patch-repair endonuclease
MKKLVNDHTKIIQLYLTDGLSITTISKQLNISRDSVIKILRNNNIKLRTYKEQLLLTPKIISLEQRKKLSESLKLAHKEKRHPGWISVNSKKESSYPEIYFLNMLKNDPFFSKYTIIEKHPFSKYVLDFVIIDLKLDIELDGQFHFNDEKTIAKDKIRDEFMITNGWKVFRIAWTKLKDSPIESFNCLKQFIHETDKSLLKFYQSNDILSPKDLKILERNAIKKQKNDIKMSADKILLEELLNSDIDFSKHGWVKKASILLKKPHQKINSWLKIVSPELLESSFKRSRPI